MLEEFVCVRVVQGWGMDLGLIQVDRDLTWFALVFHPDRTLYLRYGTRAGQDAGTHVSLAGFKNALGRALEIHAAYPGNRKQLEGKLAPPPPWRTPEAMPALGEQFKQRADSRKGCIHCHNIHEGDVVSRWRGRKGVPDGVLWPFPMPDLLGLEVDEAAGTVLKAVAAGTPAAKGGLQAGDVVSRMDGQAVFTLADVQWALQQAKEGGSVRIEVLREGKVVPVTLAVPKGWRRAAGFDWRVSAGRLAMSVLGFRGDPVEGGLRVGKLISPKSPNGNKAALALLQEGDLILFVDGKPVPESEGDLLAYVIQGRKPGERLVLELRRGGKVVKVVLPVG